MPYKRKKAFTISIDEPDNIELEKQTKRHKLTKKFIVGYLIQLNGKNNFFTNDWKARLEDRDNERARYTRLDGACPALTYADKLCKCVWGQDGKPPAIRNLAKEIDEALDLCAACTKTLKIKLENESYQAKVQDLERQLNEKAKARFKVPQCHNGGRLSKDITIFEGCPRSPGKPVSIEGYCKKLRNGQGCDWLRIQLIAVGDNVGADIKAMK